MGFSIRSALFLRKFLQNFLKRNLLQIEAGRGITVIYWVEQRQRIIQLFRGNSHVMWDIPLCVVVTIDK